MPTKQFVLFADAVLFDMVSDSPARLSIVSDSKSNRSCLRMGH